MTQETLTHQDLIDLYLLKRESAVKQVGRKGYKTYQPAVGSLSSNALFFRKNDDSGIIFMFDNNMISDLIYSDSLENLNVIVSGLKNSGWSLYKKRDKDYEVYKKEATDFLFVLQLNSESEMPVIQLMEKFKKQ